MKQVTYILPIKSTDTTTVNNFISTLNESIQLICIGVYDKHKITRTKKITHIAKDSLLSDCLNEAIKKVKTSHLSILAYDDTLSERYEPVIERYLNATDYDVYLPMIIEKNSAGSPVGLTNNYSWTKTFTKTQGFLDFESLNKYGDYLIYGGVFKKELFEEMGYFKPSLDTMYEYEFLLRVTRNDSEVFVIPKTIYTRNSRVDNRTQLLKQLHTTIEINDIKNRVMKECYFKSERKLETV